MKAIDRIISAVGMDNIIEILSSENLNWADFHTLLLHVFNNKVGKVNPYEVLRNYEFNRFSSPSELDQRELIRIDDIIYRLIPSHFSAIELSPVAPIGANSALTPIDPKVVLSTIRNLEVVGDSSTSLAIECAKRRKLARTKKVNSEVHLATSHRVLRLQDFPKNSDLSSHFRAFSLASASRDTVGFNKFELTSLCEHIEVWLNFLDQASRNGYPVTNISVVISDIRIAEKLMSNGLITKEEIFTSKTKDVNFSLFSTCGVDLPDQIGSVEDIKITNLELETYIRGLQFTERQIVEKMRKKYQKINFLFHLSRYSGVGYYSGLCYRITADNSVGKKCALAGGGASNWISKMISDKKEHLVTSGFGTEMLGRSFKVV